VDTRNKVFIRFRFLSKDNRNNILMAVFCRGNEGKLVKLDYE